MRSVKIFGTKSVFAARSSGPADFQWRRLSTTSKRFGYGHPHVRVSWVLSPRDDVPPELLLLRNGVR